MQEILERSDNTGMTFVGELLGKKKMLNYVKKLGIGKKTGVDLEGEANGYVKNENEIYDIDQATMTFGQGISLTSMQMIKAWGAIATGKTMKPHLAEFLLDKNKSYEVKNEIDENVYSASTVQTMKNVLTRVCENSPLHFSRDNFTPNLKKYKIAAKSGTAQIPLGGKYAENKTIGTAIGFAPADNPRFLLYVKLDEPAANIWGANTAGSVFFNILKDLFIYYNIPPQ